MKTNVIKILIGAVFLVLFNALFFYLGGFERTKVDWICYGFIHVSYLSLLITPLFSKYENGLDVLSNSLYFRATLYFFAELFIGVLCIIFAPENAVSPVIIQSVLLAIFLIFQMMALLANDSTMESVQKQRQESYYIQNLAQRIRTSIRNVSDPNFKKQIERCYEAVRNSSLESFSEAKDIELRLSDAVELLCVALDNDYYEDIDKKVKKVLNAVQDRNAIIKRCRNNY